MAVAQLSWTIILFFSFLKFSIFLSLSSKASWLAFDFRYCWITCNLSFSLSGAKYSWTICRYIVGLAGPPGAGKTTVASEVACRLNKLWSQKASMHSDDVAIMLPLDGFHLYRSQLDAMEVSIPANPSTQKNQHMFVWICMYVPYWILAQVCTCSHPIGLLHGHLRACILSDHWHT